MKFSLGLKEVLNLRNLWMHIVIASPLSSTQLLSYLMVVVSKGPRLQMRFLFQDLSLSLSVFLPLGKNIYFLSILLVCSHFLLYNPLSFLQICVWPFQLEMEDGDEIDAMLHQTGGAIIWDIYVFYFYGHSIRYFNVSGL